MVCFVQIIDFLLLDFSSLSSYSSSCVPPVASASTSFIRIFPRFLPTQTVGRNRNNSSSLALPDLSPCSLNTVPGLPDRSQGAYLMETFCSQVTEPSQSVSHSVSV